MHRNRYGWHAIVCTLAALPTTVPARAGINYVSYGSAAGDLVQLHSIGISRGADNYSYAYADLISPTLSAINSLGAASPIILHANPLGTNRDQVLSDPYLNTGFLEHGNGNGDFTAPGAQYIKLSFPSPVYNHDGPDLIACGIGFEFDSGAPFTSSRTYVSFDGSTSHLVNRAADRQLSAIAGIPMYAYSGITAPAQLVSQTPRLVGYIGNDTAFPTPVIHALDLSDFGIAANGSVSHLWLQHDAASSWDLMPTLIAGLPAIPEPATGILLLLGAFGLASRRSSRP